MKLWDNVMVTGTLVVTGSASTGILIASSVNLLGNTTANFGSNQTKAINAGSIGYQTLTPGAMDIVGAGTVAGSRNVKLWDNVMVPGSLAVAGTASTGALTASSVSTPTVTVAGTRVYSQVNADWTATSGLPQILNKPTKLTQFTNDLTGSSAGWSVPGSLTVAGISQVGGVTVTAGGGQQVIVRNTATDTSGLAEVFFDRTAALSTAQAAIGIAPSLRGAYWWVNGSDRLNISTAGNVTIPGTLAVSGTASTGTLTASSVNLLGNTIVNFGSDQTKATNAGSVGYQIATPGVLDIYGGGALGSRNVKVWDNLSTGTATASQVYAGGASGGRGPSFSMPVMTANTTGGFTVSGSVSSYAYYAFDSSSTTSWGSGGSYSSGAYSGNVTTGSTMGEYLQIQTPVACQLQSYSLYGSSLHALNAFSIMGSLDGITYTTIDTRLGQNCRTQQDFTAPSQTMSWLYFRLIITQDLQTPNARGATSPSAVVSNFAPFFLGIPYVLDVNGPSRLTGALTVTSLASTVGLNNTGNLAVTGTSNLTGNLAVTGTSNLTGAVTASSGVLCLVALLCQALPLFQALLLFQAPSLFQATLLRLGCRKHLVVSKCQTIEPWNLGVTRPKLLMLVVLGISSQHQMLWMYMAEAQLLGLETYSSGITSQCQGACAQGSGTLVLHWQHSEKQLHCSLLHLVLSQTTQENT